MRSVYVVTMWSGGRPARKWKSNARPEELPNGTGVFFTSIDTKLQVTVIGSISIEEYESGKEDIEQGTFYHRSTAVQEDPLLRLSEMKKDAF